MRLLRVTFYTPFLYRYVRHFGFPRSAPALIRTVLAFPQRDIRSMRRIQRNSVRVRESVARFDGPARFMCIAAD
jgi:hypothetical protein